MRHPQRELVARKWTYRGSAVLRTRRHAFACSLLDGGWEPHVEDTLIQGGLKNLVVTYYTAFVLEVQSRRIQVIGCARYGDEGFVIQCLREATLREFAATTIRSGITKGLRTSGSDPIACEDLVAPFVAGSESLAFSVTTTAQPRWYRAIREWDTTGLRSTTGCDVELLNGP